MPKHHHPECECNECLEEADAISDTIERTKADIVQLEAALNAALEIAIVTHHSVMKASEAISGKHGTDAAHPCLALMELSQRNLSAATDAAKFARQAIEYEGYL